MKRHKRLLLTVGFCILTGMKTMGAEAPLRDPAEAVSQLSREEKAGQMLAFFPSQLTEAEDWTADMDTVLQNVKTYHIGTILFGASDLEHKEAVKELTAALAELTDTGKIPVLTIADPSGSLDEGLTKPAPEDASVLGVGQLVSGENAVWAYGLAQTSSKEPEELGIAVELLPGKEADIAVVTHEKVENPMDDGRPASMSRSMVTLTLREVFSGAIMTDSLSMTAATENYGADMAVMYALQAGADILTAPANVANAYYGILSAIDEQLVTEEQIDASVVRILEGKKDWIDPAAP